MQGLGIQKPNQKKYFIFIRWSPGSVLQPCSCKTNPSYSLFILGGRSHDWAICLSGSRTFLQLFGALARSSSLGCFCPLKSQQISQHRGAEGSGLLRGHRESTDTALPNSYQPWTVVRAVSCARLAASSPGFCQIHPSVNPFHCFIYTFF